MKHLLALILCTVAFSVHAKSDLCSRLADMTEAAAFHRDAGLSAQSLIEVTVEHAQPPAFRDMMIEAIIGIYTNPNMVRSTPAQIKDAFYMSCVDLTLKSKKSSLM
ncbi:hypothetical protein [Allopusillimonas ginsengisoli]|uniref:hypothetical protein n=1 Tax=Allopusillimonas ginsengisoli TaxID=453575 RepID=UPI00101EB2DD|nr:hypothetical protein [Allopusillimonas ginsengisoli]TEA78670.1 hypothetical protein ERE07_09760 [Allopusillimonas ginsengisoli]